MKKYPDLETQILLKSKDLLSAMVKKAALKKGTTKKRIPKAKIITGKIIAAKSNEKMSKKPFLTSSSVAISKQKMKLKNHLDDSTVYPDEEQGILPEETEEEMEEDIQVGQRNRDIYTSTGREVLEEEDEIKPWEEGFMEGATETGQLGKDALTGEPLMTADKVVETKINGKLYRFSSRKNAEGFKKKLEKSRK